MSSLVYRKDIDGLRAIAVLAVLFFHAELGFSGGYIGVDVFFVISGFLITSLILRQTDQDSFSLKEFWIRRIRRIAPALIIVVLAVLSVAVTFMLPQDLKQVGRSAYVQPVAGANFFFWQDEGYFAGPAILKPLLHTWSLAVEEQFYLLFPLLLIAFGKYSRKTLANIFLVIIFLSFGYSIFATYHHPSAAFFLLPARAWELLSGSLLACLPSFGKFPSLLREICSWSGLGAIVIPCILYTDETAFPGLTALPPVLGTILIILANTAQTTSLGRLLSLKPLVGIGLISYSLYLWHWPLLAFTSYWLYPIPTSLLLLILVASFLFAWLSWKYIETPFRKNVFNFSHGKTFSLVVGAQTLIVVIGVSYDVLEGFPQRMEPALAELSSNNRWVLSSTEAILKGKLRKLGIKDSPRKPSFLLWGDSHAATISNAFNDLTIKQELYGFASIGPHTKSRLIPRPFEVTIQERNTKVEQLIYEYNLKHIFLVQRWDATYSYWSPGWDDYEFYTNEEKKQMDSILSSLLDRLSSRGCTVYLLSQVPRQDGDEMFRQKLFSQVKFPELQIVKPKTFVKYEEESQYWMVPLKQLAEKPGVELLDIRPFCFDSSGNSYVFYNGISCYRDDDHLSDHGARHLLNPLYAPILKRIRQEQLPTPSSSESVRLAEESSETSIR